MRSEVRQAMATADLVAEQQADESAAATARRVAGVVGVFVFGLIVVFSVIAVAALASTGKVDGGFWTVLLSLPVNSICLGGCWRAMWRGVGD